MARLHGDGFDHYGSTESFLLDNEYATADPLRAVLSTDHPATGTHGIKIGGSLADSQPQLRKVLPSAKDKLGAAGHFYFDQLPPNNTSSSIFCFLTPAPLRSHVSVVVTSSGSLRFYRGMTFGTTSFYDPGTLVAESDPVIGAGANHHIEVQVYIHDTLGWVRAAVNGVHVYSATGLDTTYDATTVASVGQNAGSSAEFYMDNYHIYDFTGNSAVDTDWCPSVDGSGIATNYIGELQAMYQVPEADTAEDDWVPSTGSDAYAMVDETSPNDADYISAANADDLTEFAMTDLPEEITYIRGIDIVGRMSKADAGAAMIKFGMKSVADTSDSDEFPITVIPSYWREQINVDPDSGARWTRNSFNAAWLRLLRSV